MPVSLLSSYPSMISAAYITIESKTRTTLRSYFKQFSIYSSQRKMTCSFPLPIYPKYISNPNLMSLSVKYYDNLSNCLKPKSQNVLWCSYSRCMHLITISSQLHLKKCLQLDHFCYFIAANLNNATDPR